MREKGGSGLAPNHTEPAPWRLGCAARLALIHTSKTRLFIENALFRCRKAARPRRGLPRDREAGDQTTDLEREGKREKERETERESECVCDQTTDLEIHIMRCSRRIQTL